MDPLFDSLTDAQRQAVSHLAGPLLILAGPGSGKTRVVTHRIAHLIRTGVSPRQIVALTFTNKAASEMRDRVERLAPGKPVWIGTFHRFCARLLREHAPLVGLDENFSIYDTGDSLNALKRSIESLDRELGHFTPQQLASAISWAKNNLLTADAYRRNSGSPLGAIVEAVYPAYRKYLLQSNAVDFDDLILHVARLLRENSEIRQSLDERFEYVMVDEYQDTNLAQYAIVRALSVDHPNLAVTGDPDQSIYGWRGANLRNILDFEHDYPDAKVVRLERNYRSTPDILSVAQHLIRSNRDRKQKDLFTENAPGSPVRTRSFPTHGDEARQLARHIAAEVRSGRRQPRDFVLFYRTNALSRGFEMALSEAGLPYQMVNGVEFYQRREIKDALAYLTLLNNPRDNEALLRIINTPARGIGQRTIDRLADHAASQGLPLLEAARQAGMVPSLPTKSAVQVAKFVSLYDDLDNLAAEPVETVLRRVLEASGYLDVLQAGNTEDDHERLANLQELVTAAREFDRQHPDDGGLEAFLEQSCLVNDTDAFEEGGNCVTMMTLHSSKGLEFPVVFVVALEDGLIPHERSKENPKQVEEERRLLFVGMTRAREELWLTWAKRREFRGRGGNTVPSAFLENLPREEIDGFEAALALPPIASDADWDQRDPAGDEAAFEHASPAESTDDDLRFDPSDWSSDRETAPARHASAPPAVRGAPAPPNLVLRTAADLLGAAPAAYSPGSFQQGMAVLHPEYGVGKIVALDGNGAKRMATVLFREMGQRRFVLGNARLRPLAVGEA